MMPTKVTERATNQARPQGTRFRLSMGDKTHKSDLDATNHKEQYKGMPDTLEHPAFTPHFADPEKARQARARQTELAQHNKQELENLRQLLQTKPIEPEEPTNKASIEAKRQIELTNELVTHARAELKRLQADTYGHCETCKRHGADAKEQAALLRELRGLMEHLCRLHNIAQAPTSKANPKPAQARHATVQPIGPAPQQAVVPPVEPQP